MGTHHRLPHHHGAPEAEAAALLGVLRSDGGRITTGRRAIVEALVTADDHHVTAEDVAEVVQRSHPEVHLSTVYRTLEALEDRGVLHRVDVGGGPAVFHLVDHAHHHLVCDRCGSVTEATDEAFAALRAALVRRHGFMMSSAHLAVHGRCASCAVEG